MSQPIENLDNQDQGETEVIEQTDPKDVSDLSADELKAELKRVRQEAASRRVKNRELEEAARKWQEYQDSQKTELQKLQDQLAERDKEISQHRVEKMREQIAKSVGLSLEDADLLTGSDEETLKAQAERLKERLGKQPEKQSPVDLLPGKRGNPIGGNSDGFDMDSMIRKSARRADI